jgi:hypothetical protein
VIPGPKLRALSIIPLNFIILNGFPFNPVLSCKKKTGPLDSSLIKIAEIRKIGDEIINKMKLIIISVKRLIKLPCFPIEGKLSSIFIQYLD